MPSIRPIARNVEVFAFAFTPSGVARIGVVVMVAWQSTDQSKTYITVISTSVHRFRGTVGEDEARSDLRRTKGTVLKIQEKRNTRKMALPVA